MGPPPQLDFAGEKFPFFGQVVSLFTSLGEVIFSSLGYFYVDVQKEYFCLEGSTVVF